MGGIGAEITGGDFWRGAAVGGIVAGANHGLHQISDKPTYEYNGKEYRSKADLYAAILADQTMEQFGIKDLVALGAAAAGADILPKRFVTPGSSKNTSVASKYLGKIPEKSPVRHKIRN